MRSKLKYKRLYFLDEKNLLIYTTNVPLDEIEYSQESHTTLKNGKLGYGTFHSAKKMFWLVFHYKLQTIEEIGRSRKIKWEKFKDIELK